MRPYYSQPKEVSEDTRRSIEKICRESGDVDQLSYLLKRNANFDVKANLYVSRGAGGSFFCLALLV
jgi:hypothetical protein